MPAVLDGRRTLWAAASAGPYPRKEFPMRALVLLLLAAAAAPAQAPTGGGITAPPAWYGDWGYDLTTLQGAAGHADAGQYLCVSVTFWGRPQSEYNAWIEVCADPADPDGCAFTPLTIERPVTGPANPNGYGGGQFNGVDYTWATSRPEAVRLPPAAVGWQVRVGFTGPGIAGVARTESFFVRAE